MNSNTGDDKGIKDDTFEDFLVERDLESTFFESSYFSGIMFPHW